MRAAEILLERELELVNWRMFQEFFILTQFWPSSPFVAVRPLMSGLTHPFEPRLPKDVAKHFNPQQARIKEWVQYQQAARYQPGTEALVLSLNPNLSEEGKRRASKTMHITKLYENISWQRSLGIIFPGSLKVVAYQTKKIWVPQPLTKRQENYLPGTWKLYEFPDRLEYVRLK